MTGPAVWPAEPEEDGAVGDAGTTQAPVDDDPVVARLRAAGCVFAEDEARLLRGAARDPGHLDALVARRVAGEPLEPLVGWAEFGGLRIVVAPGVFVPRRRTEYLARRAVELLAVGAPPVLVDLCCGTGAVAAVAAARVPGAEVHAADADAVAVACARRNLRPEAVHHGDLFAPLPGALRGRITVLTAIAPYVPTDAVADMPREARDHEPRIALDGGADGLDVVRRLAADAGAWLVPGGHVLLEVGDPQVGAGLAALRAAGLVGHVEHDDDADSTLLVGVRP